ncbi:MAG: Gfo/Idh/MocA family oxidoreductase [Clostridiales bacterium]|nr:Gfo/Idh/MocA family oxidoreductase [Clostridiales bacterium]
MKTIRMCIIGIGGRGKWWLGELLKMEDVEITAVCDKHEDRMEAARAMCAERYGHEVYGSTDYRDVLARDDGSEAVLVTTYWNDHVPIAIAAMKTGRYAAFEVGPAQSIRQCWDLVRTYEETGVPCMLMENCCYNREEMTILNMIKKGLFGEILHCQGGYQHDLRSISNGMERDHERTWQYLHRNAELYPTHELGPIMTYLDINRGNRMMSLNSMATKSRGLQKYVRDHFGPDHPLANADIRLGDIVTTTIRCANGETIVLTHDTSSPRPYSRGGRVQGTCGLWMEDLHALHIEGRSPGESWEPMENYWAEFEHPLWKKSRAGAFTGGHGGMDWLVMRAFLNAVRRKIQTPIDVYDSATLMAIAELSEESIATGSAPVAIPDFTDGRWVKRDPGPKTIFSLAEVDESLYDESDEY